MRTEELVFPVAVEAFIAHQEELAGGKLDHNVREVEEAWVPAINASYEAGLRVDKVTLLEDVAKMDSLIVKHNADSIMAHFLKSCRWWIIYAWDRGRKGAEKAVAV